MGWAVHSVMKTYLGYDMAMKLLTDVNWSSEEFGQNQMKSQIGVWNPPS